jgi:hypothetical protein
MKALWRIVVQFFASVLILFYVLTAALPVAVFAQTVGSGTLTATPTSGKAPVAVTFTATRLDVTKTYSITYGDGKTSVPLSPQCATDNTSSQSTGCFVQITHTYTQAGSYTATVAGYTAHVITVTGATAGTVPPTCYITVKPTSISVGGSVTVLWTSTNATAGAITNIGNVGPSGSINLLPPSNGATYFGAFTGPGGTANCQATVTVNSGSGTGGGNTNTNTNTTPLSSTATTPTPATPAPNGQFSGLVPCGFGTFTGGNESSSSTGCQACNLAQLIQNIITFAIGIAIPIAAALFAYAGFLYITSASNPANIGKAKGIFKDALVGFLIAVCAWLIINTLLHVIFNQGTFSSGNWFTIQCSTQPRPVSNTITQVLSQLPIVAGNTGTIDTSGGTGGGSNTTGGGTGSGSTSPGNTSDGTCNSGYSLQIYEDGSTMCVAPNGTDIQNPTCPSGTTLTANNQCFADYTSSGSGITCPTGSVYLPDAGTCSDANGNLVNPLPVAVGAGNGGNISAAALAYQGTDTSVGPNCSGGTGGQCACAYSVNQVLQQAGIQPIDGNSVALMQQDLNNGRGTLVGSNTDLSNTSAGDIVVWKTDTMSHVGICENNGCTQVISNSSSNATFSTVTDAGFNNGVTASIYKVNK